jgi:protein ImuB
MFATIYLPNFYLQAALRYEPHTRAKAVALIEEHEKKPVIIQLNAEAESVGVRKGMTPSQALARYLQIIIKARAQSQENSMQDILLQSAFCLSPYIEDTAPGIATVEFSDTRNLTEKVTNVVTQLAKCEMVAQAGIANLPDTSFLAAHLARPVLQIDNAKEFLAPLPIETLAITLS